MTKIERIKKIIKDEFIGVTDDNWIATEQRVSEYLQNIFGMTNRQACDYIRLFHLGRIR